MRQLEGKVLATDGAKPKGKEQPAKYDKAKQGTTLATQPKAYNADADVASGDAKEEKKVREVRVWGSSPGWSMAVCRGKDGVSLFQGAK